MTECWESRTSHRKDNYHQISIWNTWSAASSPLASSGLPAPRPLLDKHQNRASMCTTFWELLTSIMKFYPYLWNCKENSTTASWRYHNKNECRNNLMRVTLKVSDCHLPHEKYPYETMKHWWMVCSEHTSEFSGYTPLTKVQKGETPTSIVFGSSVSSQSNQLLQAH